MVVVKCIDKTITSIVNMEIRLLQLFNPCKIFDFFEIAILLLHTNVQLEIIKVIKLFLDFLKSFDAWHVHNMMVIMLDPHFKALHIVQSLVCRKNACNPINILNCWHFYTITFATTTDDARLKLEKKLFGMETSIEKPFQALIIGKLFLFMRLSIFSSPCVDPLTWWCMHEG